MVSWITGVLLAPVWLLLQQGMSSVILLSGRRLVTPFKVLSITKITSAAQKYVSRHVSFCGRNRLIFLLCSILIPLFISFRRPNNKYSGCSAYRGFGLRASQYNNDQHWRQVKYSSR